MQDTLRRITSKSTSTRKLRSGLPSLRVPNVGVLPRRSARLATALTSLAIATPCWESVLLVHYPLQATLRFSIRERLEIVVQRCVLQQPIIDDVSRRVEKRLELRSKRTYHSGLISDTVLIYGLVVRTNSLKRTHSGCPSKPHEGCSATTWLSFTVM